MHTLSDEVFETDCTLGLDRISEKYEHYILLGDLNFDMLDKSKSSKLNNVIFLIQAIILLFYLGK